MLGSITVLYLIKFDAKVDHSRVELKYKIIVIINTYKILISKPQGRKTLWRTRHRWKDKTKVEFEETGYKTENYIQTIWERVHWYASMKIVMNLKVPYKQRMY
jgi:hypothetical protein